MRIIASALMVTLSVAAAHADASQSSSYNYFAVKGRTPKAVYDSILSQSQRRGGINTYATTQVGRSLKFNDMSGGSCARMRADIVMQFKINLPRLEAGSSLSDDAMREWRSFSADLKHHEEHHRSIWMGCAARFVAAIRSISTSSCEQFTVLATGKWQTIEAQCRAQNDAFDASEQQRLRTIPFIRRVIAGL